MGRNKYKIYDVCLYPRWTNGQPLRLSMCRGRIALLCCMLCQCNVRGAPTSRVLVYLDLGSLHGIEVTILTSWSGHWTIGSESEEIEVRSCGRLDGFLPVLNLELCIYSLL